LEREKKKLALLLFCSLQIPIVCPEIEPRSLPREPRDNCAFEFSYEAEVPKRYNGGRLLSSGM
jgi:hypothetical protein